MFLQGLALPLQSDFDIRTAGDADQAIAVLEDDGPFAVTVTDMQMPGMSGIELLAQAAVLVPATVRILMTGYSDEETAVAASTRAASSAT